MAVSMKYKTDRTPSRDLWLLHLIANYKPIILSLNFDFVREEMRPSQTGSWGRSVAGNYEVRQQGVRKYSNGLLLLYEEMLCCDSATRCHQKIEPTPANAISQ